MQVIVKRGANENSSLKSLIEFLAKSDGIKNFFAASEVQTILTKTMPEVLTLELKKRQLDRWIEYWNEYKVRRGDYAKIYAGTRIFSS